MTLTPPFTPFSHLLLCKLAEPSHFDSESLSYQSCDLLLPVGSQQASCKQRLEKALAFSHFAFAFWNLDTHKKNTLSEWKRMGETCGRDSSFQCISFLVGLGQQGFIPQNAITLKSLSLGQNQGCKREFIPALGGCQHSLVCGHITLISTTMVTSSFLCSLINLPCLSLIKTPVVSFRALPDNPRIICIW